ncbi:hypothetical protein GL263_23665 [Streptomyces durbertensis]|uniref:Uncharacterized protein n=1 Tax=Streptomyces durbertensis TaxID=2448886 RepID=A0ABR6EPR6_9ACTN|nr:hypothetical protein [Streptomyces durbertensis]
MTSALADALRWHRPLMLFSAAMLLMAVLSALGLVIDDRVVVGARTVPGARSRPVGGEQRAVPGGDGRALHGPAGPRPGIPAADPATAPYDASRLTQARTTQLGTHPTGPP